MRILYHHRTQAEDGQAVHIRALQRAFAAEGHQVFEVALVAWSEAAGPRRRSGWGLLTRAPRLVRELAEYAYGPLVGPRLVRAGREHAVDLVYERYAFGGSPGAAAARRLGVPAVLEVNAPMAHELGRTRGLALPRLARRVEARALKSADLVCVVTAVLGDMLLELGVERERLLVTPNGVDLERYGGGDRRAARAELGLTCEPSAVVLGFVGYYRDWHRLDLAIDALASAPLAGAHLALVGEGPAHEALLARAAQAGVGARVHFCGPRPHERVPALLAAFDVALVPAINPYASPLKLHEYMAAELALVAPDQPNLREVLEPGRNALLFPPGDGAALTAALGRLCADPALRAQLGRAARATVVERDLTWRGNARRIAAAVATLMSARAER